MFLFKFIVNPLWLYYADWRILKFTLKMLLTSKDIKNPGLRTLPPGVEKFFVKGGGLSVIEILPEDKIEIVNDEGMQLCEIIVFNSKGKSDLSILGLKENADADFSKRVISNDEKISKLFKKKNLNLNNAKSSILFSQDCTMGEKKQNRF